MTGAARYVGLLLVLAAACNGTISDAQDPEPPLFVADGSAIVGGDAGTSPVADAATPATGPVFPPGELLLDLGDCVGELGGKDALGPNPVAVYGEDNVFFAWFGRSDFPQPILVSHYDGERCSDPIRVNVRDARSRRPADSTAEGHDAPSIYIDGAGFLYVTYFGRSASSESVAMGNPYSVGPGAVMRRSTRPLDITEWEDEQTLGYNTGEMFGEQLRDGSILLVGNDNYGRFNIIEPGGAMRFSSPRQVVTIDGRYEDGGEQLRAGWTKTQITEGPGGLLYATWGFSCPPGATSACPFYTNDHQLVYFAYSDDGGVTWYNRDRTASAEAPLCPPALGPDDPCYEQFSPAPATHGILMRDPAYELTVTRQRGAFRSMWVAGDGTIFVAFKHSTREAPGLSLARFRLGAGPVDEILVNGSTHGSPIVRTTDDTVYVWAVGDNYRQAIIYSAPLDAMDDPSAWNAVDIHRGANVCRLHGNATQRLGNSIHLGLDCYASTGTLTPRTMFYYRMAW